MHSTIKPQKYLLQHKQNVSFRKQSCILSKRMLPSKHTSKFNTHAHRKIKIPETLLYIKCLEFLEGERGGRAQAVTIRSSVKRSFRDLEVWLGTWRKPFTPGPGPLLRVTSFLPCSIAISFCTLGSRICRWGSGSDRTVSWATVAMRGAVVMAATLARGSLLVMMFLLVNLRGISDTWKLGSGGGWWTCSLTTVKVGGA